MLLAQCDVQRAAGGVECRLRRALSAVTSASAWTQNKNGPIAGPRPEFKAQLLHGVCLSVCLFFAAVLRPLVCCTWFVAHGLLRVVYLHAACCMLRVARCLLSARSCILNIGLHAASRPELHCLRHSLTACVRAAGCWSTSACPLRPCRRCSPSARCPTCARMQHCNGATVETRGVSDVQHTRACTHARARTCTYARAHTHALARTCTHALTQAHARTCTHGRTCTHALARTQKRANARTHV